MRKIILALIVITAAALCNGCSTGCCSNVVSNPCCGGASSYSGNWY